MLKKPIDAIVRELSKKLPHRPAPNDDRTDYSTSFLAPVVVIFVKVREKILALHRSQEIYAYPDKWSVNAGFLDKDWPIECAILEELTDELGLKEEYLRGLITKIKIRDYYKYTDKKSGKEWLRVPVLVELREEPAITLNFEHTKYLWVDKERLLELDTPPGFAGDLERALG